LHFTSSDRSGRPSSSPADVSRRAAGTIATATSHILGGVRSSNASPQAPSVPDLNSISPNAAKPINDRLTSQRPAAASRWAELNGRIAAK
jgi:hypothetical protein